MLFRDAPGARGTTGKHDPPAIRRQEPQNRFEVACLSVPEIRFRNSDGELEFTGPTAVTALAAMPCKIGCDY